MSTHHLTQLYWVSADKGCLLEPNRAVFEGRGWSGGGGSGTDDEPGEIGIRTAECHVHAVDQFEKGVLIEERLVLV